MIHMIVAYCRPTFFLGQPQLHLLAQLVAVESVWRVTELHGSFFVISLDLQQQPRHLASHGWMAWTSKRMTVKRMKYSGALSVTADGRMLMTGHEQSKLRLYIYRPENLLLNSAWIRVGIPFHVVETLSHDFIIVSECAPSMHKLFMINKEGDVMRTSEEVVNSGCYHMAVTGNCDVFTVDQLNQ